MADALKLSDSLNGLTLVQSPTISTQVSLASLLERVDAQRIDASACLNQESRSDMGQFLTPLPVARLMASMLQCEGHDVSLLDAGAGIGTLLSAVIEELCLRGRRPKRVRVVAYEIDSVLLRYLEQTLALCLEECERCNIEFSFEIRARDFMADASGRLNGSLSESAKEPEFTCAIQNPPYRKINRGSDAREFTRTIGVETSNLYAAFVAATLRLLKPGGELVAITPRSFCNGPYFRPFREFLLSRSSLKALHLFDSRQKAFKDDAVLQETVIFKTVVGVRPPESVQISSSADAEDELLTRELHYSDVVHPNDPESFIHIVQDGLSASVNTQLSQFTTPLADLGLTVSTGKVVDFRVRPFLLSQPSATSAPLIYSSNFQKGQVTWPKFGKKPLALEVSPETLDQFVPNEEYVLVKRFSTKEEKRRIVAAIYDPKQICCERVGFENHLNYFHANSRGINRELARGLFIYLNSSLVDSQFRQFNGHTQVNATDLRNMRYPSRAELQRLGTRIESTNLTQQQIDYILKEELMPSDQTGDPIEAKKKIEEATRALTDLGFPRQQLNERSALTLLALLDLKRGDSWSSAEPSLIGITPMIDFMKLQYGKEYKPNTRETVRRQTVHQFVQAALILENPDKPERPTNSPKTVYRIEPTSLQVLKTFGSKEWDQKVREYLAEVPSLKVKYAQAREVNRIPIKLPDGVEITLSAGGQNELVKRIMGDFAEIFTPGGKPLYVGDTGEKHAYYNTAALAELGVMIESHGKMPDVIIYHVDKDWLILIEAVTSHGPINPKRQRELKELFAKSMVGLVLVTAFLTRKAMVKYLSEISWETEVWVAEAPEHLIHFNGERFLGPY